MFSLASRHNISNSVTEHVELILLTGQSLTYTRSLYIVRSQTWSPAVILSHIKTTINGTKCCSFHFVDEIAMLLGGNTSQPDSDGVAAYHAPRAHNPTQARTHALTHTALLRSFYPLFNFSFHFFPSNIAVTTAHRQQHSSGLFPTIGRRLLF